MSQRPQIQLLTLIDVTILLQIECSEAYQSLAIMQVPLFSFHHLGSISLMQFASFNHKNIERPVPHPTSKQFVVYFVSTFSRSAKLLAEV
ncbi:MAG: hypothetical protein ACQEWV_03185 [Bacillota bacterium]